MKIVIVKNYHNFNVKIYVFTCFELQLKNPDLMFNFINMNQFCISLTKFV